MVTRPATAGRNAPCPCGSGRKYKKCCGPRALPTLEEVRGFREQLAGTVERVVERHARETWGALFRPEAAYRERFSADPWGASNLFFWEWRLGLYRVEGLTAVDLCLRDRAGRFRAEERAWLEARRAAPLSAWRTESVDPGNSMVLRDLLGGGVATVVEGLASLEAAPGQVLLAQVVETGRFRFLEALFGWALSPEEAGKVLERVRAGLRLPDGPLDAGLLREERVADALIREWVEAARPLMDRAEEEEDEDWDEDDEEDEGEEPSPAGEEASRDCPGAHRGIEYVLVDRLAVAPGRREEVAKALLGFPGAVSAVPHSGSGGEEPVEVRFRGASFCGDPSCRCSDSGSAKLTGDLLSLLTDCDDCADDLRRGMEHLCGASLRFLAREKLPVPSSPGRPAPSLCLVRKDATSGNPLEGGTSQGP